MTVSFYAADGFSVAGNLEGEIRKGYYDHCVSIALRYRR